MIQKVRIIILNNYGRVSKLSKEIAKILLKLGAVKLSTREPFTWASGIKSPIYCDNRQILGDINSHRTVIEKFKSLAGRYGAIDVVAGTATAGIPHATLLADRLDLPSAYVRSSKKSHGTGRQIEGAPVAGKNVLLIEDLISTGGSSLNAVVALKEEGANVVGVLAIFSYGIAGVEEKFSKADCKLEVLTNLDTILREAVDCGVINSDEHAQILEFRDGL